MSILLCLHDLGVEVYYEGRNFLQSPDGQIRLINFKKALRRSESDEGDICQPGQSQCRIRAWHSPQAPREIGCRTLFESAEELFFYIPGMYLRLLMIKLTISCHDKEDHNRKSPFEVNAEEYESNADVDERRNDVEKNKLQCMVDSSTTIKDP